MELNALRRALHAAADAFVDSLATEQQGTKATLKRRARISSNLPVPAPTFTDEVSKARAIAALRKAGMQVPDAVLRAEVKTP